MWVLEAETVRKTIFSRSVAGEGRRKTEVGDVVGGWWAHERLQDVYGLRGQKRGAEKLKKKKKKSVPNTFLKTLPLDSITAHHRKCLPVTSSGRSSRRDLQ